MQYVVLKSFAGKDFTGVKGKIIEIEDKKIIASLIAEGYIEKFNVSKSSNKELEKEIAKQNKAISDLELENELLKQENEELKLQLESFTNEKDADEESDNKDTETDTENSENEKLNKNNSDDNTTNN